MEKGHISKHYLNINWKKINIMKKKQKSKGHMGAAARYIHLTIIVIVQFKIRLYIPNFTMTRGRL